MKRGDVFDLMAAPTARLAQAVINSVVGTDVFVTLPSYDAELEFGPCLFNGSTPIEGRQCLIALPTDTSPTWIVAWDGAGGGMTYGHAYLYPVGGGVGTSGGGGRSDPIVHGLGAVPAVILLTPYVTFDEREDYAMSVYLKNDTDFVAAIRVTAQELLGYSFDPVEFDWLAIA